MMSNANSDLIAKILTEDLLSEDSSESEYEPSVDEEEDFLEQEEDVSESSEEEADSSDGEEPEQSQGVFISKNSQETWSKEPQRAPQGRQPALNVMNRSPGPTRHALREVDTIESSFRLFMKNSLLREIIHWSNKEGRLTYGEDWKAMDETELSCFLGLLILAGVFKAHHEAITELWNKEDGRAIFSASMARSRFQQITRILRFDNAESRRRQAVQEDKLQPIRSLIQANQERRVQMPPPLPQKAQKRGRCSYCARSNDLKQSTFCSVCAKFVCNEHSRVVCYVCMQP